MSVKKISRRDAMKLLGAAIGGAALSTLPSKWNTPELAAGVLPAHARQSGTSIPGPTSITAAADVSVAVGTSAFRFSAEVLPATAGISIHFQGSVSNVSGTLLNVSPGVGDLTTNASGHIEILITWNGGQPGDSISAIFVNYSPFLMDTQKLTFQVT